MPDIRFKFAPAKARAAIHWMIRQQPGIDLHALLKACYFADKEHLNKYDRPVFGATYRAMKFGPVPLEIYEMAKGEPIHLAELEADRYPWSLRGYSLYLETNEEPDLSVMSKSDMEELEGAVLFSSSLSFSLRSAVTHGSDWQAANLGRMRYEDMFGDIPDREEKIAYLREAARHFKL